MNYIRQPWGSRTENVRDFRRSCPTSALLPPAFPAAAFPPRDEISYARRIARLSENFQEAISFRTASGMIRARWWVGWNGSSKNLRESSMRISIASANLRETKGERLLSRLPLISGRVRRVTAMSSSPSTFARCSHVDCLCVYVWQLSALISMRRRRWNPVEKFRLTVAHPVTRCIDVPSLSGKTRLDPSCLRR